MKVIDNVIAFVREFKEQGFMLDYQTETKTGLVQVYVDFNRMDTVIVSGPADIIKTIIGVLENN